MPEFESSAAGIYQLNRDECGRRRIADPKTALDTCCGHAARVNLAEMRKVAGAQRGLDTRE